MSSLASGEVTMEEEQGPQRALAGGVAVLRWRFLFTPPTQVPRGEPISCVVALTDDTGTELDAVSLARVGGAHMRVRCEVWSTTAGDGHGATSRVPVERLCGQAARVKGRSRWRFAPVVKTDVEPSCEWVVMVACGEWMRDESSTAAPSWCPTAGAFDPLHVLAVWSEPVRLLPGATNGTAANDLPRQPPVLYNLRRLRFPRPGGESAIEVTIRERYGQGCGSHLWSSSLVLAAHLAASGAVEQCRARSAGRVIELGSGLGLAGIVACLLGARVTLTDTANHLPLLGENAAINGCGDRAAAEELQWGGGLVDVADTAAAPPEHQPPTGGASAKPSAGPSPRLFDLVLAADVMYSPKLFLPLLQSLTAVAAPDAEVLMAYSHRSHGHVKAQAELLAADAARVHAFFVLARERFGWATQSVQCMGNVEVFVMTRELEQGEISPASLS